MSREPGPPVPAGGPSGSSREAVAVAEAVALIERARAARSVVVAGVEGRSGVGKSTWATSLARAVSATLVDGDSFYAGGTSLRRESPAGRAGLCLDRPKQRHVLECLKAGRPVAYRPFDWEAFDGSLEREPVLLEPRGVVVVDGVYSCHPDLEPLVDVKILLVAAAETRLARLLGREGEIGDWERQWHEAEDWYYGEVMAVDRFDLVVRC